MPSGCRCHMMGRACLAPAVHELSAGDRELGTHIGVAEGEDRSGLVLALCHYKLKVAVLILCDSQVRYRAYRRIELCQIAATHLAHYEDRKGISRQSRRRLSDTVLSSCRPCNVPGYHTG